MARRVPKRVPKIGLALAITAGCNAILGIEEKPLRSGTDAGALDATPDVDAAPAPSKCATDADCVPPNGCYTGHCNGVLGACAYAMCEAPGRACAAGTCDQATWTCSAPKDYGFRATSYPVPGVALGCRSPDLCVAAAFPFLILGTQDGVAALRVDDLVGTGAAKVALDAVPFRPAQLVTSGRRVWVLGDPQGTAPPYQLPIATIDVPSDPTVSSLTASTALLTYAFPAAVGFAAPGGSLYLVYNDVAQGLPVATLTPPLPAGASVSVANPADAGPPSPPPVIPMFRVAAPASSAVVASSGGRLVVYRFPHTVNLIAQPGTPSAAVAPDLALNPLLPALAAPRFASGPDGVVMLAGPITADPSGDCNCTTHERLQWVFPNATATGVDAAQIVDAEGYGNPQVASGACHQCNPTYFIGASTAVWIDAHTALVAAPASDPAANRAFTATRVVGRDPLSANAKRRFVTTTADVPQGNFATDRIALTSSSGFGYEILADSQGNKVTLSIFDPNCDAK